MSISRFNPFKKKTNINVISLRGVIGDMGRFSKGLTLENSAPIIEKAFTVKKPKVVVIQINSPGGSPVQSELIYNKIRVLADENKVKVITIAEDVAASGGYMLMCAGDELLANKSSIVGSIGVISASFGFKDLIEKIGIQRRIFTAGENKSFLDPFVDVQDKDVDKLIKVQVSIFENFKSLVLNSRKNKVDPDKVCNGEFWTGEQGIELGLVDSNETLVSYLDSNYGKNYKLRTIESKKSFFKGLVSSKSDSTNSISGLVETLYEELYWGRYGR
jgi:signal peptide peptidase SppA